METWRPQKREEVVISDSLNLQMGKVWGLMTEWMFVCFQMSDVRKSKERVVYIV